MRKNKSIALSLRAESEAILSIYERDYRGKPENDINSIAKKRGSLLINKLAKQAWGKAD